MQEEGLAQTGCLTGMRDDPSQWSGFLERTAAAQAVGQPIAVLTATTGSIRR